MKVRFEGGGPVFGSMYIPKLNIEGGGIRYQCPLTHRQGYYGEVNDYNGKPLMDQQGFLILRWCGWDGEGVE